MNVLLPLFGYRVGCHGIVDGSLALARHEVGAGYGARRSLARRLGAVVGLAATGTLAVAAVAIGACDLVARVAYRVQLAGAGDETGHVDAEDRRKRLDDGPHVEPELSLEPVDVGQVLVVDGVDSNG